MDSFRETETINYCVAHSSTPCKLADELEAYTKKEVPMSQMLIGKLEASLLGMLIRLGKVKRVLEFGTFTGYSALVMAEQLPEDGELITLDLNEETTRIAQSFWDRSEHGKKIKSFVGPALENIKNIKGSFDFVFIDADKLNYPNYLELGLERLSPGGMIVCDNMLWSGKVYDENIQDEDTLAIRTLNQKLKQREDLYTSLLPIRDGMHLIMKK